MDTLLIIQAIVLGVVEGLTEFIPVSSTGHLIMLIDLLNFKGPPGKVFEIIIQLGAICAVCWVYKAKLWSVVTGLPTEKKAQHFTLNIILAFLPAAIIGVLAHDFIKSVLFSPWVVAITLIVGGVIIIVIESLKLQPRHDDVDMLPSITAFKIGCCQVLAMVPGVSRSGATIMGSLLLGVERKAATEFSFFLAVPTMFGATVYDIYKNFGYLNGANTMIIAIGFISAFLAAMVVIRTVIAFISKHGFVPFAWYRIIIGSAMLTLLLLR